METLTAKGHQHVIDKTPGYLIPLGGGIKYSKYETGNDLVFSRLDLELVEIILCLIVENHIIIKDVRYVFLDIDAYQRSQGSEKTCATNAWDELTSLRITDQFRGGGKKPLLTYGMK